MAISPDLPGLTLSIRVHGRKLPEYRDTDIQDPPRVISYMIEAIPDTVFSIHAHASPEANFTGSSFALYFYVDGKYVDGALIDSSELRFGHGAEARSQGRYVRDNMLRRYQFASRERQIELVETVSTSLSSRPRTSKKSSMTPIPSYSGYEGRNITPSGSSLPGVATYVPSGRSAASHIASAEQYHSVSYMPSARSEAFHITPAERYHSVSYVPSARSEASHIAPAELYHSVANAVHPTADTVLPTRLARGHSAVEPSNVNGKSAMTIDTPGVDEGVPSLAPFDLDHRTSKTTKVLSPPRYNHNSMELPMRLTNIPEEPFTSQPELPVSTSHHSSAATPSSFAQKDIESATAGSDFTAPEELGTIKIIVTHVNKKGAIAFGRNASTTAEIGKAAQEAAKEKSGGLLVRFTAPQIVAPVETWDVGAVNDDDEDTSVTYLYHYRTREMLEALEVVPVEVKEERVRPPGLDHRWRNKMEEELGQNQREVGVMKDKAHPETLPDLVTEDPVKVEEEEGVQRENNAGEKGGVDGDWEMIDDDGV